MQSSWTVPSPLERGVDRHVSRAGERGTRLHHAKRELAEIAGSLVRFLVGQLGRKRIEGVRDGMEDAQHLLVAHLLRMSPSVSVVDPELSPGPPRERAHEDGKVDEMEVVARDGEEDKADERGAHRQLSLTTFSLEVGCEVSFDERDELRIPVDDLGRFSNERGRDRCLPRSFVALCRKGAPLRRRVVTTGGSSVLLCLLALAKAKWLCHPLVALLGCI